MALSDVYLGERLELVGAGAMRWYILGFVGRRLCDACI